MKPLVYLPGALADVIQSARWYGRERPGLEYRFLAECNLAYQRLALHPDLYAPLKKKVRRVLVRNFPFAVYYRITEKHIEIIAILSTRINPDTIESRIGE